MVSSTDITQTNVSPSTTEVNVEPILYGNHAVDPLTVTPIEKYLNQPQPDGSVLTLTPDLLNDIYAHSGYDDIVQNVLTHPGEFLYQFAHAAKEAGYGAIDITGDFPATHQKRIEDLRAHDIGTLVQVECRVTDRSEHYPRALRAVWTCVACGQTVTENQPLTKQGELESPTVCPNDTCQKRTFKHTEGAKGELLIDTQELIVQDLHAKASSANPSDVKANLYGHLVHHVESGNTVTLTAIPQAANESGVPKKDATLQLQVVGVEHQDIDYKGVTLTDDDIAWIQDLANSNDAVSRLAASIAPNIVGEKYTLARKAGLVQLIGGVNHQSGASKDRADIHVAYVGDPGTGKSAIGRYLTDIAPTGVYQSADNVTKVGLTAAAIHEDRFETSKWTVSGGPLVRADGGLCVIDELDKAKAAIKNSLQEPLSEQQVSVSKANIINVTLSARCAVMLIANPIDSRFNLGQELRGQIEVNDVIWDRMDIIVPFVDQPNEAADATVADAILGTAMGQEPDFIDPKQMRKFVAYARQIDPVMTAKARSLIAAEWVDLRARSKGGRISVGKRQLKAMLRISEAFARIRLSETVDKEDAEQAIDLMDSWMSLLLTDANGNLDMDRLSGTPASTRSLKDLMWTAIDTLDTGDGAPRVDVVTEIEEHGEDLDRTDIQQFINKYVGRREIVQEDGLLFRADGESP